MYVDATGHSAPLLFMALGIMAAWPFGNYAAAPAHRCPPRTRCPPCRSPSLVVPPASNSCITNFKSDGGGSSLGPKYQNDRPAERPTRGDRRGRLFIFLLAQQVAFVHDFVAATRNDGHLFCSIKGWRKNSRTGLHSCKRSSERTTRRPRTR